VVPPRTRTQPPLVCSTDLRSGVEFIFFRWDKCFPQALPQYPVAVAGRYSGSSRGQPETGRIRKSYRDLSALVSFQFGWQSSIQAPHRQRCASFAELRSIFYRSYSRCIQHRVCGPHESGVGHALVRHRSALCRTFIFFGNSCEFRWSQSIGSAKLEYRSSRLLHALPGQQCRLSVTCDVGTRIRHHSSRCQVELHPERVPTPKYIIQRRQVTESPLQMRKEMHVH